jgi:hypothetical protein
MRPKGSKKNGIKYLSESELAAFMKAVRKNRRDSFLFSLMLFVGGRVSEISQLRLKDVNEQSFQILIQGKKGGTSRYYTLSGRLWKKYQAWMRERARIKYAEEINTIISDQKKCEEKGNEAILNWYQRLINAFEYYAFFVNRGYLSKDMETYCRGALIFYVNWAKGNAGAEEFFKKEDRKLLCEVRKYYEKYSSTQFPF